MDPLIQDILRRHLSLPAEEQPAPEQREEGSYSERDLGGPPWRCPNCHRLNTNERKRCKHCEQEGSQTPFF